MKFIVTVDSQFYNTESRSDFMAVRRVLIKLNPESKQDIIECETIEDFWDDGWDFDVCAEKNITKVR